MANSAFTGGFLGTLNGLSGTRASDAPSAEDAKRAVLERLQAGEADMKALSELSMPASLVEQAVADLTGLGLVERGKDNAATFQLSPYAGKALSHLIPR
jgi:hypothetical protein